MKKGGIVLIIMSFLIAFMLTIIPLPHWAIWFRPNWVVLVLVFYCFVDAKYVGLMLAFVVGLILDTLTGTLLGQHALALVVVAYFVMHFRHRLQLYRFWQQWLLLLLLIFCYQAILFWVQGLIGQLPDVRFYFLSSITSAVLWPWVSIILRDLSLRYKLI